MKILGTGLSGLVGSRIIELLSPDYSFENLSLETGVDITDKDLVRQRLEKSQAPWVFHFAARTDVDGCEREKELGEKSGAWAVNVLASEYIVNVCKRSGKKLLYLSTDYVFDGTKDAYSEDDTPNPQSWYALTKYEGEKRVLALGEQGLIVRIANPYRARNDKKLDFVHKILTKFSAGEQIWSPHDQVFIPTLIDDVARAVARLVSNNSQGIYHVVGSQWLTPYAAAKKIAHTFGFDPSLVVPTTFSYYFQNRAPRPFRAVLKNDKIAKFGIHMATFDGGLNMIKDKISGVAEQT